MYEFDLKLGATVNCTDGKCGQLAKYAVNPGTHEVRSLIVEKGFLLKEARIFPVELVERVSADGIDLDLESQAIGNYHQYRFKTVEQPVPAGSAGGGMVHSDAYGTVVTGPKLGTVSERIHEGVSPTLIVVDGHTMVEGLDETIGSLTHLVVAPDTGSIRRLVVRRGALMTKNLTIPGALLREVSEERLYVDVTERDIDALPEYQAGDREDGTRAPQGTPTAAATLEQPPAEEALATTIERLLISDPRTEGAAIDVIDDRGIITLEGTVDTPQARAAAEVLAAQQPGVISVTNNLRLD